MRISLLTISIIFALTGFSASPVLAATFNGHCASHAEREALNFRAMQSELMVAALSCNKRDAYNKFVTMNQANMPALGQQLHGYFQRTNAGNAKGSLNSFVTDLANKSSKVSLNMNRGMYCRNADTVFRVLLNGANPHVMSRHFSKLHNISSCES